MVGCLNCPAIYGGVDVDRVYRALAQIEIYWAKAREETLFLYPRSKGRGYYKPGNLSSSRGYSICYQQKFGLFICQEPDSINLIIRTGQIQPLNVI